MNKIKKILYIIALPIFCFGFSVGCVHAAGELVLEKITDCGIIYMGDSCAVELKMTNNTGKLLDGTFGLSVWYANMVFDDIGMSAEFLPNIAVNTWLASSIWVNGTVSFTGFDIAQGETLILLKINTHPALYPGEYEFMFSLKGETDDGEEYVAPPVIGGGGGGILGGGSVFGDINGDGKVDKYDFALMMAFWGQEVSGLRVDLNGDGKVDKYDFALLMLNWNKS